MIKYIIKPIFIIANLILLLAFQEQYEQSLFMLYSWKANVSRQFYHNWDLFIVVKSNKTKNSLPSYANTF